MKNLGIKTKKFVRKITAIASAALLSGVGMGAGLANLTSLSDNFITGGEFDAYVALGTQGATNVAGFAKDVAGSIVVAAAFAQQATTTTTSSGSATLTRNLTTGYMDSYNVASAFRLNGGKNNATSWINADSGFSWLPNSTVSNATDPIANQTGDLRVLANKIRTDKLGRFKVYDGAIVYSLNFSSLIGQNATDIMLPGSDSKTYEITGWVTDGTNINLTLGSYKTISDATLGQDLSVPGYATFEVTDYTQNDEIKVKVLDLNGKELFNDWVSEGDKVYSNDDFTLKSKDVRITTSGVEASFDWSTSAYKLVDGESTPTGIISDGENWKIDIVESGNLSPVTSNNTNMISRIVWTYDAEDSFMYMNPSEQVSMMGGFFNLTAGSLKVNSTDAKETTISISNYATDDAEITFKDENGTSIYYDFGKIMEDEGVSSSMNVENATDYVDWWMGNSTLSIALECNGDGSGNLTLLESSGATLTVNNGSPTTTLTPTTNISLPFNVIINATANGPDCANAKFNLTVINAASAAGVALQSNMSFTGADTESDNAWDDGALTFAQPDSESVTLNYANGTIDTVTYSSDSSNDILTSDGDVYYTNFGTKIVQETSSEVTVYYPETYRLGKLALGKEGKKEYVLSDGEYSDDLDVALASGSGSSIAINSIDVGLAKLDSELTSSSLSKPVILIGGWAVNSLVNELVTAGEVNSSDISMSGEALVQLIEGSATMNDQDVLVIAGWTGDDTRLAAQLVASEVLTENFGVLSGSKTILNTGVTSVSDVTSK